VSPRRARVTARGVGNADREPAAARLARYREVGTRRAGSSMLGEPSLLASFATWLESNGTSFEHWTAVCAESGAQPTFTVALANAYLADKLNTGVKPKTASARLTTLIGALSRAGWDVEQVRRERSKRQCAMTSMVKTATARLDPDDVRRSTVRARPLTTNVITSMTEHLEHLRREREVSDLWAIWMRALVLTGFAAALRINEIARLEWEWCTFSDDGVIIEVPRSKATSTPKVILVPRGAELCPVRALEALRSAYAERNFVFARVFALPIRQPDAAMQRRRDLPWVDIVGDSLADTSFYAGRPAEVREAAAARVATKRIERHLRWLLGTCGVSARTVFERPTTHGFRRGCATELANAGVTLIEIAKHLRHNSIAVTSVYIEGADLHIVDPARASKGWTKANERRLQRALADLEARLPSAATLRTGAGGSC
jgi:integrase